MNIVTNGELIIAIDACHRTLGLPDNTPVMPVNKIGFTILQVEVNIPAVVQGVTNPADIIIPAPDEIDSVRGTATLRKQTTASVDGFDGFSLGLLFDKRLPSGLQISRRTQVDYHTENPGIELFTHSYDEQGRPTEVNDEALSMFLGTLFVAVMHSGILEERIAGFHVALQEYREQLEDPSLNDSAKEKIKRAMAGVGF